MIFATDIVHDLMRRISSAEPVLFQRNGYLYITSEEGFGMISCGINPEKESYQYTLRKSKDGFLGISKNGRETSFNEEAEKKYVRPITPDPGSDNCVFFKILEGAAALQQLPDDGKIRILDSQPDHKSIGVGSYDVFESVTSVHVMEKSLYSTRDAGEQDSRIRQIKYLASKEGDLQKQNNEMPLLDCVVMTPYFILTFPRLERLHDTNRPDSWNSQSRLRTCDENEDILTYNDVYVSDEKPYRMAFRLNGHGIFEKTFEEFVAEYVKVSSRLGFEAGEVTAMMPKINKFLAQMNDAHKVVYDKFKEQSAKFHANRESRT